MKRTFFITLFLLPFLTLHAQVTLNDLMKETGTRLIWDSELQVGTLYDEDERITFTPHSPDLVVNFSEIIGAEYPLYTDGVVSFTDETARLIYDYFSSHRQHTDHRVTVILLDPGHGGKDWGAYRKTVVDGHTTYLKEKNINLDMALRVEAILNERYPDKTISLTRRDDTFISLKERVAIAESYQFTPQEGMIFLSIHANSSLNETARGFEVWYLPDDVDRDLTEGGETSELDQILNGLWEGVFTRECYNFARFLLDSVDEAYDESFPNRGLKRELWYVLRNKNMVSALAELAFVSNVEDRPLLQDEVFLDNYAHALADGMGDFIEFFED